MSVAISVLPVAMWLGSIWLVGRQKVAVILPAICFEAAMSNLMDSPFETLLGNWLVKGSPKRSLNLDTLVERLEAFFIIVLGEGILALVQPLDAGLTFQTSLGLLILVVYYQLFWLNFNGDQTKTFVHATVRHKFSAAGFLRYDSPLARRSSVPPASLTVPSFHALLLSSLLLLASSLKFFISHSQEIFEKMGSADEVERAENLAISVNMHWTITGAFSAVLLCMTGKALLNRSLDRPGTLKVGNRYLRTIPRILLIVFVLCLNIPKHIGPRPFLGMICCAQQVVLLAEHVMGMDKQAKWIEPKA